MQHRPLDLPQARIEDFLKQQGNFEERLTRCVSDLLSEIPIELLSEQVDQIAFTGNSALYKRPIRMKSDLGLLVDQLAQAFEIDGNDRETLLKLTLSTHEYYDILDDLIDGDVSAEARQEVLATWQVLAPLNALLVHRLETEAVAFWSDRTMGLMECFLSEGAAPCTAENYKQIVERQSDLFGCVTGLPPVVGGLPDRKVHLCEQIGQDLFKIQQFLADAEQHREEDGEQWNAWELYSQTEFQNEILTWKSEAMERVDELPSRQAEMIEVLFAINVEEWLESTFSNSSC